MTSPTGLVDPAGSSSEPFRALRVALERGARAVPHWDSGHDRARPVLFTSPSPRDGKTTLAVNHALVTAVMPRRTLLIDAHLHRPRLHERLACQRLPGLADVLEGDCKLAEALQPVGEVAPALVLLAAGRPVRRTADLLGSAWMSDLLRQASSEFDAVIVDSPAVLELPDAAAIAGLPDVGTLVVADAGQRRARLSRTLARLAQVNAAVLGVALNRTAPDGA